MATTQGNNNKLKFSCLDLVSNTDGASVSATGFCGTLMVIVALCVFVSCVVFYFFNVTEAANVFNIINSTTAILGIGAGTLGVRRISSDFGPNNRVVIGGSNEPDEIIIPQRKPQVGRKRKVQDVECPEEIEQVEG